MIGMTVFTMVTLTLAGVVLAFASQQARKLVRPPRQTSSATPRRFGIHQWENVEFRTSDGLTLRGWFVPVPGSETGAAVVCTHGTAGHRGHLLPQLKALHAAGFHALLFDLRSHGESDGRASGLGVHEVDDVLSAVRYLRTRSDVNPERIGLIGHSMGGAAVLRAAARTCHVQAVVSISSAASLSENVESGLRAFTRLPVGLLAPLVVRLAEWQSGARMREMRPVEDAARLRGRPLLLVHGAADRVVGIDNAARIQQAHGGTAPLIHVTGAGHRTVLNQKHFPIYQAALVAFLREHLLPPESLSARPQTPTPAHAHPSYKGDENWSGETSTLQH